MLNIHKVNTIPVTGASDSVYMKPTVAPTGPHKAWRLLVTSSSGAQIRLNGLSVPGGHAAGTPFASSSAGDVGNVFDSDNATSWVSVGPGPEHVGMIYTIPYAWESVTLRNGADFIPNDFKVQYSDDTTDGTTGTWIDVSSLSGQAAGWTSSTDLEIALQSPHTSLSMSVVGTEEDKFYTLPDRARVIDEVVKTLTVDGHVTEVADIAARDALTLTTDLFVLVLDATGDTNVPEGMGLYEYSLATDTYRLIYSEGSGLTINVTEW